PAVLIQCIEPDSDSYSGRCARLGEAHRQMLDPGEKVRAEPLDPAGQLDLPCPFEERLQHQAQFEARQMRARAIVFALAESQMLVRSPSNVEAVRIREDLLIAIGRGKPEHHAVAVTNLL